MNMRCLAIIRKSGLPVLVCRLPSLLLIDRNIDGSINYNCLHFCQQKFPYLLAVYRNGSTKCLNAILTLHFDPHPSTMSFWIWQAFVFGVCVCSTHAKTDTNSRTSDVDDEKRILFNAQNYKYIVCVYEYTTNIWCVCVWCGVACIAGNIHLKVIDALIN